MLSGGDGGASPGWKVVGDGGALLRRALVTETEELSRGWMAELLQGVDGRWWGTRELRRGDGQRRGQGRCIRRGWLKTGARELRWGRMVGGGNQGALSERGGWDGDDGALTERVVDATDEVASSEGDGWGRGQRNFVGGGWWASSERGGWDGDGGALLERVVDATDEVASSEGDGWS
ncbi:hypothetical protein FA13DRAFT_1715094 [Coprinellus micaceus]|uniref:Uncharacterized protein n=1 Tax=Coprinellus micaceus TaxID=71717 RepID=A0A4Y7SPR0_COPMI|nr:hypothetical protein FA13DRAFT_1715094 [Coprinellus micaceus]